VSPPGETGKTLGMKNPLCESKRNRDSHTTDTSHQPVVPKTRVGDKGHRVFKYSISLSNSFAVIRRLNGGMVFLPSLMIFRIWLSLKPFELIAWYKLGARLLLASVEWHFWQ